MTTIFLLLAIVALCWIGMLSAVFMGGLLFMILTAVFAGLKLAGIIEWSW